MPSNVIKTTYNVSLGSMAQLSFRLMTQCETPRLSRNEACNIRQGNPPAFLSGLLPPEKRKLKPRLPLGKALNRRLLRSSARPNRRSASSSFFFVCITALFSSASALLTTGRIIGSVEPPLHPLVVPPGSLALLSLPWTPWLVFVFFFVSQNRP